LGVVWNNLVVRSIVAWFPPLIQWLKNFSCYLKFFGQWSKNLVTNLGNGKHLVKSFGHQIKQIVFWVMDDGWIPTIDLEIEFFLFLPKNISSLFKKNLVIFEKKIWLPTWNFLVIARMWQLNNTIFSCP